MTHETWDEAKQTLLLVFSFAFWGLFEFWCYKNPAYASLPHTSAVRLVLTNIVTGLFTYIYTKSKSANGQKGE